MKTVIYGATQNIYRNVVPCVRSLQENGNVDEIILLCEHDELPFDLGIKTINVMKQTYYARDGINARKRWTYMTLMKCAVADMFPDKDKVLFLDCDTIVLHDLSKLWDIDLGDNYYAAVEQPFNHIPPRFYGYKYINAGVLMCNLEKLRDGKEQEIREALNTIEYQWPEQDCITERCQGHILSLPGRWNSSPYTVQDEECYIRHFAANPDFRQERMVRKYDL